jgi:hypothetical protein
MSAILVFLLALVGFLILAKKTWAPSGAGFAYGFLDSAYLYAFFFTLLTGIVLTAANSSTGTWEASGCSMRDTPTARACSKLRVTAIIGVLT